MDNTIEATLPPVGFGENECLVCNYSSVDSGLLDLGDWPNAPSDMRPPVCPFCAVYFTPAAPLPEMVTPSTTIELRGAWRDFSDQLLNYHANLSRLYHRAKVESEEALPEVLRDWGYGDASAGVANAMGRGEGSPLPDSLWPMLACERILQRISAAYGYVELLEDNLYKELGNSPTELALIEQAVARDDVKPVWELFLAASANRPPRHRMTRHEVWRFWGEK